MLGNRRAAGSKISGDLADRMGAAAQHSENLPPRRVGDGAEHGLQIFK
jgi:hypothetical protein